MYYVLCKCRFRDKWNCDLPPFDVLDLATAAAWGLAQKGHTEAKVENEYGQTVYYIDLRIN